MRLFLMTIGLGLVLVGVVACSHDALPSGDMGGAVADLAGGGGAGGGGGSAGSGGSGGNGAHVCLPTCVQCSSGACCGNSCCAPGEWCDTSDNSCHCGTGPACRSGQMCNRGGPGVPDESQCGAICCGGGTVCPL